MKEVIRRCLVCAGQMQEAGISCQMVESSGGKTGECPGCHKRKLCFNWKIERKEGQALPSQGNSLSQPDG